MHLRTVARIPGLFRGKERERRLEAVACRKLIIAGAALPERTQPLGEDLVVEMRCRVSRLAHERLRPRERLALGRQRKRNLVLSHL